MTVYFPFLTTIFSIIMYAFLTRFMVCMMYAFLNRPFYARREKLGKKKIFSSVLHWPNNSPVNPTCPVEGDVKNSRLTRFFLNKILRMLKFKSFFSRKINFLELPKYSWNLQMSGIIEKFVNWKILLKNNWKIGTPFGTLARQVEWLLRLWHVGTWASRPHRHAWHVWHTI